MSPTPTPSAPSSDNQNKPLTLSPDEALELRYAAKRIVEILDGNAIKDSKASNPDWRSEAPSSKQLAILKQHGYAIDGLTKGQATDIISGIFKKRGAA